MSALPRHILVLPSWYPPDGGQFFQDQAEALAEQGFRVDILVNRTVGLSKLRRAHVHTYKRFSVQQVGPTRVIRSACVKWPWMEIRNAHRWSRSTQGLFRHYCRRFGTPDLILVHSFMWAGYAAAKISEETGVPYVLVEHRSRFTLPPEKASNLLKSAYRPFIEIAFAGASRIVTVSEGLQPAIRGYLAPGDDAKLVTIPNLVDTALFSPDSQSASPQSTGLQSASRQSASPQSTGLQSASPPLRILSVGRLDWEKGMDVLIAAFASLKKEFADAELHIVGDGPEKESLQSQVSGLGLTEDIQFLGKLSPACLAEEFRASSFFVLASRYEAFGVVYIEAMATGLPVVATRAGGPQTFIPDFAGELVEVDREEELCAAMQKVASGLENYDAEKIRRFTLDHFSREAVSGQTAQLINEVLGEKENAG